MATLSGTCWRSDPLGPLRSFRIAYARGEVAPLNLAGKLLCVLLEVQPALARRLRVSFMGQLFLSFGGRLPLSLVAQLPRGSCHSGGRRRSPGALGPHGVCEASMHRLGEKGVMPNTFLAKTMPDAFFAWRGAAFWAA